VDSAIVKRFFRDYALDRGEVYESRPFPLTGRLCCCSVSTAVELRGRGVLRIHAGRREWTQPARPSPQDPQAGQLRSLRPAAAGLAFAKGQETRDKGIARREFVKLTGTGALAAGFGPAFLFAPQAGAAAKCHAQAYVGIGPTRT
jgi:hypothetical protein